MPSSPRHRLLPLAAALSLAASARADWSLTVLDTSGFTDQSSAYAGAGATVYGNNLYAAAWSADGATVTDFTPPGTMAGNSIILGATATQQVGQAFTTTNDAFIWSGSAASAVDLAPTGALNSTAFAISGSRQAGFANFTGTANAGYWTGSAASFVNLHPTGSTGSYGRATDGTRVGGYAYFGDFNAKPLLWAGTTADAYTNLLPSGMTTGAIYGMSGSQQVGYAGNANSLLSYRAAIWTGTAESFVNLNPSGANYSMLYGTDGTRQVGTAYLAGVAMKRALVWNGAANDYTDLGALLPTGTAAQFTGESEARAIWTNGSDLYVAGTAYSTTADEDVAVVWKLTGAAIPVPSAYGLVGAGAAAALAALRRRRIRTAKPSAPAPAKP